jgi:hypothetical protein
VVAGGIAKKLGFAAVRSGGTNFEAMALGLWIQRAKQRKPKVSRSS